MSAASQSEARTEILARIRASIADSPAAPPIPRGYRRRSELTREQIVDMLEDRLIDYKAEVHRENLSSLPGRLAELLGESSVLVPEGLEESWLPQSLNRARDEGPDGAPPDGAGTRPDRCAGQLLDRLVRRDRHDLPHLRPR